MCLPHHVALLLLGHHPQQLPQHTRNTAREQCRQPLSSEGVACKYTILEKGAEPGASLSMSPVQCDPLPLSVCHCPGVCATVIPPGFALPDGADTPVQCGVEGSGPTASGTYMAEWKPLSAATSCVRCGDGISATGLDQVTSYDLLGAATQYDVATSAAACCKCKPLGCLTHNLMLHLTNNYPTTGGFIVQ